MFAPIWEVSLSPQEAFIEGWCQAQAALQGGEWRLDDQGYRQRCRTDALRLWEQRYSSKIQEEEPAVESGPRADPYGVFGSR